MSRVISSTELQKKTREVIDWARTKGEPVVVETYGKPMAAILSYDEYQAYQQYKQARSERFARLRSAASQNAASSELTHEQVLSLIDEIRQEIYDQKKSGD